MEYRETACRHWANGHRQTFGAKRLRAKCYPLLPKRARRDAIGVEAHQFIGEPHARLQHISAGRLVGEGSGDLYRFVLRVKRSRATHLVAVALIGLSRRGASGKVARIAKEAGSQ